MQNDNVFMSEGLEDSVYEASDEFVEALEPKTYLRIDDLEINCGFHKLENVDGKNILSFITNCNVFYYLLLEKNINFIFDLVVKKPVVYNVDKNIHKIEKFDDIYLVSIDIEDFKDGV